MEATEQDLRALDEKPDFKEALVHLKSVAPKAYVDLLERAKNLEAAENWNQAVAGYERLDNLLENIHRYGVVFETVNVKERLSHAKQKAAEYHYANAETSFAKNRWRKAASAYLKAHDYIENYNQSLEKAIRSFFKLGDRRLENNRVSGALNAYQNVLDIAPGHREAKQKIAEAHYRAGRHYFKKRHFREALKQFETIEEYASDYKDAAEWVDRAYEEAVQYLAVFPFKNETAANLDGFLLAAEILQHTINGNLKFVDFLNQGEMAALLHDHNLNRYRLSEAHLAQVAQDEGLDSFIWGRVLDIDVRDKPQSFVEYEHKKTVVVEDSAGNKIEETELIYFREYSRSRVVRIAVEYVIVDSETGRYLHKQGLTEDIADEARWIAYQGSIYDLPKEKRPLLDAPRNPRPPEVLIDDLLLSLGKNIARDLLRFYR